MDWIPQGLLHTPLTTSPELVWLDSGDLVGHKFELGHREPRQLESQHVPGPLISNKSGEQLSVSLRPHQAYVLPHILQPTDTWALMLPKNRHRTYVCQLPAPA